MCKILKLLPDLESLFIGSNNWGDDGIKIISNELQNLKNLKRLTIGSSNLTDKSLIILRILLLIVII